MLTTAARTASPALERSRQRMQANFVAAKVPLRWTRRTESKSSSVIDTIILSRMMPALLTRMSSPPNASYAVATMFSAPPKSETSS